MEESEQDSVIEDDSADTERQETRHPWPYLKELFVVVGYKNDSWRMQCNLCLPKKHELLAFKNSPSNLKKHIQRKHANHLERYKNLTAAPLKRTSSTSDEGSSKQLKLWDVKRVSQKSVDEFILNFVIQDKESTLKVAERNLLEENQPKGKKRMRLPNKLYLNTQEETIVANKKLDYKRMAARRSEMELLSQDEPELSPVDTTSSSFTTSEKLEEENRALREEIKRLRDQQKAGSSADLETQVKALTKENAYLRKMAIKEIPSVLAAVKTLIADKMPASHDGGDSTFISSTHISQINIRNDAIRVAAHCWETAKAQPTAKGMARTLLLGLFSIDVLLKSNLTGGINKVDPTAERRQPLDPKKLKALFVLIILKPPEELFHTSGKMCVSRQSQSRRLCQNVCP
uniref:BED-type domain-containing protein n=1 Tax=Knipowitschia caucasica TaxID=637954 RepID=A0AAV2KHK3_KNICA